LAAASLANGKINDARSVLDYVGSKTTRPIYSANLADNSSGSKK